MAQRHRSAPGKDCRAGGCPYRDRSHDRLVRGACAHRDASPRPEESPCREASPRRETTLHASRLSPPGRFPPLLCSSQLQSGGFPGCLGPLPLAVGPDVFQPPRFHTSPDVFSGMRYVASPDVFHPDSDRRPGWTRRLLAENGGSTGSRRRGFRCASSPCRRAASRRPGTCTARPASPADRSGCGRGSSRRERAAAAPAGPRDSRKGR